MHFKCKIAELVIFGTPLDLIFDRSLVRMIIMFKHLKKSTCHFWTKVLLRFYNFENYLFHTACDTVALHHLIEHSTVHAIRHRDTAHTCSIWLHTRQLAWGRRSLRCFGWSLPKFQKTKVIHFLHKVGIDQNLYESRFRTESNSSIIRDWWIQWG